MNQPLVIPRSTSRVWAFVPAALLGSMLLGLGVLTYIATDDPNFALEPNYYDQAVQWDRSQTELRRSRELGYQLALQRPLVADAHSNLALEFQLRDRNGAAVTGAAVQVDAFPNAFAARRQKLQLEEVRPGFYRAVLSGATLGLWELRCSVRRGNELYRETLRADVSRGDAA